MRPKRTEKIKWSKNIAYVVGLLVADGNLSADGRHINFTSKDIQLSRTFKNCLGLKNKIGFKTNGYTKRKYSCVQFGDIVLYKWLCKIGLTTRKSKTIGALKIPNKYFFDFLRGCFDGDGNSYCYWDLRWKNSFMFYTVFSSGSKIYVEWLREKLKTFLKIQGYIAYGKKVWQLKYAKNESRKLIPKMYYQENLPCLERKYRKLTKHLKIDNERVLELVYS